jgi:hypothetical protein
MPRVRARNDRIRTMIKGDRPPRANALRWLVARTHPLKALLQRDAVIDHVAIRVPVPGNPQPNANVGTTAGREVCGC